MFIKHFIDSKYSDWLKIAMHENSKQISGRKVNEFIKHIFDKVKCLFYHD